MSVRRFFPLSVSAAIFGWKHRLLAVQRRLANAPVNKFADQAMRGGAKLEPLSDDLTSPLHCRICGYAMVRLRLSDGWSLETCSAYGLERYLQGAAVDNVISSLPGVAGRDDNTPITLGNLPTRGG